MSKVRIGILEKTLESKLDDYFAIVPKELFEEAQEQAFQEMDSDECTEDQCILMIKEILQIENAFKMDLMSEDGDTHISITWNDLNQKRVEEEYCEGCKTKELRNMIGGLVEKLVGVKKVEPEPVVDEKTIEVPNLVQKIDDKIITTKIIKKTDHVSIDNNMEIFTLCPQGDHNWYQSIKDEDCSGGGVKYVGEAKFNGYLILHNLGKVKMMKPHGKGKVYYEYNNKIMFEGIWSQGKKLNVKYYSQDSGELLGSYINGVFKKVSIQKIEPKVVEIPKVIPKKVQKPVVRKTEGDKTVCEKVCEGLVGYFPFDNHFNDVNGNFEKTELIGQDVKFEKRGEEKGVLLNGNNGLLITSNNFDINQSFTFYALLSIDSISRDWKFEYGNDNTQQNLIRNSSNDFFIKYYFFKDGKSNLKIQYKRKHVWRNKNNPVRKNHSIAISLEDDKNVVNIYMNGYKYQQIKSNYSERSGFSSNEWFFGGKRNGVRGLIYEIRFYNRTLSSKEIRSLSEN